MPISPAPPGPAGLDGLRRSGGVTELLFLYECATLEPSRLRPIADRLQLTVQAVSHIYRRLRRRGLVGVVAGRYCPTVEGIAWLHGTLGRLAEDLRERLDHLHVIRSTRAIAGADLADGEAVTLELDRGLLTALPGGRGPSRGRVRRATARGELAEVIELEGIVALAPAQVSIRTLSESDLLRPGLPARLASALSRRTGVLAALGLEPYALLASAGLGPIERFAVAEVGREAASLGVPVTIVVLEGDLPRLLAEFAGGDPPSLRVSPLLGRRQGRDTTPARSRGGPG